MQTKLLLFGALALALVSVSCGDARPQPGTPAFFWGEARDAYQAGDFTTTDEKLQQILAGDNEYVARARPWDIVISAGLAQAHGELADAFDAGARANRGRPEPFREHVTAERKAANAAAIQLAQELHKLIANDKSPNVALTFQYPAGSLMQPRELGKITVGMLVPDSERELLQTAMLQRGVRQAVCKAVDADDDPDKAAQKLKTGQVLLRRNIFLWAAAKMLEQQSQLFAHDKLDQPDRFILMSEEALAALKEIPETGDSKALAQKIQKALDDLKKKGA